MRGNVRNQGKVVLVLVMLVLELVVDLSRAGREKK